MSSLHSEIVRTLREGGFIRFVDDAEIGTLRTKQNELVQRVHWRVLDELLQQGLIEPDHVRPMSCSFRVYVATTLH